MGSLRTSFHRKQLLEGIRVNAVSPLAVAQEIEAHEAQLPRLVAVILEETRFGSVIERHETPSVFFAGR